MVAAFRHLTTTLLCTFLVLGQVPAWIHVASCTHIECCGTSPNVGPEPTDHSCCHHHDSPTDSLCGTHADHGPVKSPQAPVDHDSDDCPICQSIAIPVGEITATAPLLSQLAAISETSPCLSIHSIDACCGLPPARGPPAFCG